MTHFFVQFFVIRLKGGGNNIPVVLGNEPMRLIALLRISIIKINKQFTTLQIKTGCFMYRTWFSSLTLVSELAEP